MGLLVSGSGEGASKVLVDVVESWNGFHNVLSGNSNGQIADSRGPIDLAAGASTIVLFPAINGALAALTWNAAVGRTIHPYASIAAISSISGQSGAGQYSVPVHTRFTSAESLSIANWPRPFRRYRLDFLVRGTVGPGAADCACGIACSNPQGLVTGGITDPMIAWVSRSGLNAGRWTPRFRLVAAGAVTDGPDSGVAFVQAAYTKLSIVYEEGLNPRLRWLADDREVLQTAGDANMPTTTGAPIFAKVMGAGAGVTVCNYAETRFRVEEI